jgi:oxygen-independent coproporphyrinogen-3 oxidase
VNPEVALRQHDIAVRTLGAAGYAQYEVSNFARRGHQCRHNLVYWRNQHYLAAGVGAHGHLPVRPAAALGLEASPGATAVRYWHGRGIAAFTTALRQGFLPISGWEAIDGATAEMERLMLGLRLAEGVGLDGQARDAARALARRRLVELTGGKVRATSRGQRVLNALALQLVGAAPA